jgi:hypothetical protein
MCHRKAQCTQLPVSSFLSATLCHLGTTAVRPSWAKEKRLRLLGHWAEGSKQRPWRLEFSVNPTLSAITARKETWGNPSSKCKKEKQDSGPNLPGTGTPHCCPHWWLHQQLTDWDGSSVWEWLLISHHLLNYKKEIKLGPIDSLAAGAPPVPKTHT